MTTLPYKPLSRDVVFAIIEQTKGGIYLGDTVTAITGEQNAIPVVAVGPDAKWVKPGDRVFFRDCMPTIIVLNGKKYGQVSEADCMGIVEEGVDTSIPATMLEGNSGIVPPPAGFMGN